MIDEPIKIIIEIPQKLLIKAIADQINGSSEATNKIAPIDASASQDIIPADILSTASTHSNVNAPDDGCQITDTDDYRDKVILKIKALLEHKYNDHGSLESILNSEKAFTHEHLNNYKNWLTDDDAKLIYPLLHKIHEMMSCDDTNTEFGIEAMRCIELANQNILQDNNGLNKIILNPDGYQYDASMPIPIAVAVFHHISTNMRDQKHLQNDITDTLYGLKDINLNELKSDVLANPSKQDHTLVSKVQDSILRLRKLDVSRDIIRKLVIEAGERASDVSVERVQDLTNDELIDLNKALVSLIKNNDE